MSTAVSSINKTDLHDKTEVLLKVALNTITLSPTIPPSKSGNYYRVRQDQGNKYESIYYTFRVYALIKWSFIICQQILIISISTEIKALKNKKLSIIY